MSFATSAETRNLWQAVRKARRSIGAINRNATNDETGSTYASLDHILEMVEGALDAEDILLIPTPAQEGDNHGVAMRVLHLTSGEWMEAACLFPLGPHATPHQVLASQTYGRRAILQSVLNLRVRDDDGNTACGRPHRDDDEPSWVTGAPAAPRAGRTLADPAPVRIAAIAVTPGVASAPAPRPVPSAAALTLDVASPPIPPESSPVVPVAVLPEARVPVVDQTSDPAPPMVAAASGPISVPRQRNPRFAPESILAEAREVMTRMNAALGEVEGRKFLAARISGCFLGAAPAAKVQILIADGLAFLASQEPKASQTVVAEHPELAAPAA